MRPLLRLGRWIGLPARRTTDWTRGAQAKEFSNRWFTDARPNHHFQWCIDRPVGYLVKLQISSSEIAQVSAADTGVHCFLASPNLLVKVTKIRTFGLARRRTCISVLLDCQPELSRRHRVLQGLANIMGAPSRRALLKTAHKNRLGLLLLPESFALKSNKQIIFLAYAQR